MNSEPNAFLQLCSGLLAFCLIWLMVFAIFLFVGSAIYYAWRVLYWLSGG